MKTPWAHISWVFLDRIFRMAAGLAVGIWLARYLGPTQYGLLSYVLVFPLMLSALASLGINTLLATEIPLSQSPADTNRLVQTAVLLKLTGGLLAFLLVNAANSWLHRTDTHLLVLITLSACMLPVQCFDAVDVYFQTVQKVWYSVLPKLGAFLLATIARLIGLNAQFGLTYFILVSLLELAVGCAVAYLVYLRHQRLPLLQIVANWSVARRLLRGAWPLMLTEFFIFAYIRLDQIMIENLAGSKELGRYSAALRLSEAWYFIAAALSTALYPSILALRLSDYAAYIRRYQSMLNGLAGLGLCIGIVVSLLAGPLTQLLYGNQYAGVDTILQIHIWTGLFVFMGVGSNNWFVTEQLQTFLMKRTLIGAIVNVLLNLLLMPTYGAVGASVATLLAYSSATYVSNGLFIRTRKIFRLQTNALLFVPRWIGHMALKRSIQNR